jgi:alpha-tubulin suppressor-like RCC1 family protein
MGDALPFVDLGDFALVKTVKAGEQFTCVVLDGGSVKCWGANASGQLGQGDTVSRGASLGTMADALAAVRL